MASFTAGPLKLRPFCDKTPALPVSMQEAEPVRSRMLEKETIEEFRFLLNYKFDSMSPMALVLVGQTELWEKLRLQRYAAVRQRIDITCILPTPTVPKRNVISARISGTGVATAIPMLLVYYCHKLEQLWDKYTEQFKDKSVGH